jgi:ribose transport system permease protein
MNKTANSRPGWASGAKGLVNNRVVGILMIVLVLYGLILASDPGARTAENHQRLAERLAYYGVLTLGAGLLIISGGIDLSIGSVFCLAAVALGLLLQEEVPEWLAVVIVLAGAALIGSLNGLLVTRLCLQPFIVTLCGLFIYRGLANWLSLSSPLAPVRGFLRFLSFGWLYPDQTIAGQSARVIGISSRAEDLKGLIFLSTGDWHGIPVRLVLMLGLAALLTVLLHFSVYGRYLFAIGANEQAARYAGINTRRYKVFAYVVCAVLAAVGGMMELLEIGSATPSTTGNMYELYAITGAVLGGCSLRGGEGTVLGILLGTAVLPLLRNLCNFTGIPSDLNYIVIGFALLLGMMADELLKRRRAARAG